MRELLGAKWKLLVSLAVAGGTLYLFDLSSALLWFAFVLFLLYDFDNRFLGAVAILCLTACPVLLALYMDDVAEQVAVYAFFFLVMTVVLQLVDLKRHPEEYVER